MTDLSEEPYVNVSRDEHVAIVEIQRPPYNFFSVPMVAGIADAFETLEADPDCRAIVLCARGKAFCAGADLSNRDRRTGQSGPRAVNPIYDEALRLFSCTKPSIGAIHGPAIGGLGLALATDFRVTCTEARFSANFNRLGFHPGFGLSATLPNLIGTQQAAMMFYTGRRIDGQEAVRIGLADMLVPQADVRAEAVALARGIAISSPLAVQSTRTTLRMGLVDQVRLAVARESLEQNRHFNTEDFKEGVKAMAERRLPQFVGR
ncbi:enoyl-CoA hydratase/isomerase family protein [Ottowia pentelensis]|uniref:enoyl-CoA hydratase/isomerase family protein n=1 Tax=Ottowia pentelensis TaxID=511108 RepID=UPI00363CCBD8